MTEIKVLMEAGNVRIEAVGHANYAPHGQDIVCAAISAILQTAVLGLEQIAENYPQYVEVKYVTEKLQQRQTPLE